jgi:hypothetical protein
VVNPGFPSRPCMVIIGSVILNGSPPGSRRNPIHGRIGAGSSIGQADHRSGSPDERSRSSETV